jgi:hypothetical protein
MIRRVLLLMLAVSACSTPAPAQQAATTAPTTTTTTTTTTSAPPTSSAPSLADLQAKADRAALAVDGLADYGAKPEIDENDPTALTLFTGLCGQKLSFSAPVGRYRMFTGDKILLHNSAASFQARTGASVIDAIAAMAKKCTTWKDDEGFNHKITIDTTIARPDGIDGFFVFCDVTEDATKDFRYCAALMSLGDTVVEVTPTAHVSFPNPLRDLRDVLPRAAQRLLTA